MKACYHYQDDYFGYNITSENTCDASHANSPHYDKLVSSTIEIPSHVKIFENRIHKVSYVSHLFHENSIINEIILPETITSIGDYAFASCKSLKKVKLPSSILNIEYKSFYCCEELSELTIPNSVVKIGEEAFSGCKRLLSLKIPSNVHTLGRKIFQDCPTIVSIDSSNKNFSINNDVLYNKDLTILKECLILKFGYFSIPKSVIIIEEYAFQNSMISEIEFSSSIRFIGKYAFSNCFNIEKIEIPSSVTFIDEGAFCNCKNLKNISIPPYITEILPKTFNNCTELTEVILPSFITSIGEYAFKGCDKLQRISLSRATVYSENTFDKGIEFVYRN